MSATMRDYHQNDNDECHRSYFNYKLYFLAIKDGLYRMTVVVSLASKMVYVLTVLNNFNLI